MIPFFRIASQRVCRFGVAWLVVTAACGTSGGSLENQRVDERPTEVQLLTEARTRVVWVQDVADGTDIGSKGEQLVLMGYDSQDGLGERPLDPTPGNYARPLITPLGNRVVVSDQLQSKVFVVDWDGTGLRELGQGIALAVWIDPETRTEWVYVGTDMKADPVTFGIVTRHQIDRWEVSEVVWDRRRVSPDSFQVSSDGRLAGGLFPWPAAGVVELPKGRWRRLGRGCWTSLAGGDNSLFWIFDGSHRNLAVVDFDRDERWQVNINNAPGIDGYEVYHPRWANHPRFLTMTGPYTVGTEANKIRGGGPQVEIYLGRFTDDFTSVERWVKVTNNQRADFAPDAWIDPSQRHPTRATHEVKPGPKFSAPDSNKRLVVEARMLEAFPIPTPKSILPYRRALLVNEYEIVQVLEGSYQGSKILVAHWVIRDGQVLVTAEREPGSVHRMILEPYDAHPELEGERLVMDSDEFALRLYYDINS
jgi:hypothetical protein